MNITAAILDLLTKLENSLQCPICTTKCENPVRIKMCGHYFCDKCLKSSKNDHNCPKCNEFYEVKDLDYKNIAKESEGELLELRKILESLHNNKNGGAPEEQQKTRSKTKLDKTNRSTTSIISRSSDNTFLHGDKKYHVNFVNTLSKTNAKGETPLHLACKKRKFADVKKLIEMKVDMNVKDYAGWAPLHEAVQSESLEIVEYLLQKGSLIDIPGVEYVTPLHQAASLENINMVKLLLNYGANKNMVDYTGLKPVDSTENKTIKEVLRTSTEILMDVKVFEVYLASNISLYCHTIEEEQRKKLKDCKNITVLEKMEVRKLTHFVIKKTHKISFKILQAMLEGLQFLTQDLIDDYVEGLYFINIPDYEFLTNNAKLNKGIKKSMMSALLKLPKLFDGINFYIEGHNNPVNIYNLKVDREYLLKLIKSGGGSVLHRPPATRTCESEYVHPFFAREHSGTYRCCNFIIYPDNDSPELLYNMNELQHKSSQWFIDCIVNYEISD